MAIRKYATQVPAAEVQHDSLRFRDIWRLVSEYRNLWYVGWEKVFASLSFRKPMRILISDDAGIRDQTQWGIEHYSPHTVEFGPVSAKSFEEFDLVVPIDIAELVQASGWPRASKNPIPLPSRECVELCDDKFDFNQRLIEQGLGSYIPKMGNGLDRPYILKKRIGVCGRECHVIHDVAEENALREQIDDPDYFCQEIIHGTQEYATHILFANNRVVKFLNIEYRFETETPVKGKDSSLTRTICACPYLDLFSEILLAIEFQGLCCVNYKVRDGKPYILEINPRFGGSLAPYFFSFLRHLNR
jgi:hypothetical protein